MAFVLGGQFIGGIATRRAMGPDAEVERDRWLPTVAERKRVADPAHRIARRHITQSGEAADAIDICLLSAGVGSYVLRAGFDLDDLEEITP